MKVAIVLFACMAMVYGESCVTNSDCQQHGITNCNSGYHVVCENSGCYCTDAVGGMCTDRHDCKDCHHGNRPHCIDGACHCIRD